MQRLTPPATVIITCLTLLFASCKNNENTNAGSSDSTLTSKDSAAPATTAVKPKGDKPAWGKDIHPEMQAVIEKLISYNAPPIESLTAEAARKTPTPADAVKALAAENHIVAPVPQVDTMSKEIPVKGGSIHARIYTPKNITDSFPVIVYFHGGGWVIADINTYDASASGIAEQTGAIVISVEYRKGPEFKFPVAHEDAFAAYQWALKNAPAMKGSTKNIALLGESAGGNLATNVSIMARNKKIQMPVYQVLVYPVASDNMNSDSYTKYADAKPLNKAMMQWFGKQYLPSATAMADPRIALVKADLTGLPATTIITAELDPLQSDGLALSDHLKKAGVSVNYKNYDGVTHEFFGMALLVPEAKEAQALAAADFKNAFKK